MVASKGGIGKTLVACLLAQALRERGAVSCYDADPNNATLAQYEALGAKTIPLYRDGTSEIDIGALDAMFEAMITDEATVVVDNGATGFQPFKDYLRQDWIPDALGEAGRRLVVHTIVAGGPEVRDTANGFTTLADQLPEAFELVLWLNPHFGSLVGANKVHIMDTPIMQRRRDRVSRVIELPQLDSYKRHSFELMIDRRMTFGEAIGSDLTGADRSRLRLLKTQLFGKIEEAL